MAEMCSKEGNRQILYMYVKKKQNKKKNYYRKSVFLYKWLRSVGIQQECLPFGGNKKCHVTDYNVTFKLSAT